MFLQRNKKKQYPSLAGALKQELFKLPVYITKLELKIDYHRALDKREYWMIIRDNFSLILHKTICCDPSSEPSH